MLNWEHVEKTGWILLQNKNIWIPSLSLPLSLSCLVKKHKNKISFIALLYPYCSILYFLFSCIINFFVYLNIFVFFWFGLVWFFFAARRGDKFKEYLEMTKPQTKMRENSSNNTVNIYKLSFNWKRKNGKNMMREKMMMMMINET